ncbi:MAG: hypothetical protein ACREL9_02670 [Gemmatimonadales bacterium]
MMIRNHCSLSMLRLRAAGPVVRRHGPIVGIAGRIVPSDAVQRREAP